MKTTNTKTCSKLELKFEQLFKELAPDVELISQHNFKEWGRRFKYDFYAPSLKTVFEINGGTWVKSGHTSGAGIQRDYEKSNLAQLNGIKCYQLSKEMLTTEYLNVLLNS